MNKITLQDLATHRLGREASNGQDFEDARLPMFGGCQGCGASLGGYNAYPSTTGYLRCKDCIGDDGYTSATEANTAIFGEEDSNVETL